jgi:HlyD family secretion protein
MAGVLEAVFVEVGDWVEAGQPIARIECSDLTAAVAANHEGVRVVDAERALVLRGGRDDAVDAARSAVAGARVSLAQARRDLDRTVALRRARGAVSEVAEERARTRVQVAEAELRRLEEELQVTIHEPLAEDLALAEARVGRARAKLAESEAALARCTIRAPSAGTILQVDARGGEQVPIVGQRPLFRIADLSRWRVRAEVEERYATRLHPGQTALVSLDEGSSFTACGVVERLDRIMGRRHVRSPDPAEKSDRDVLEVLIGNLRGDFEAPVGYRVTVLFADPDVDAHQAEEDGCTRRLAAATKSGGSRKTLE